MGVRIPPGPPSNERNKMNCPICKIKLDAEDDPDDATRAVCCKCKISITVRNLPDDYVCENEN